MTNKLKTKLMATAGMAMATAMCGIQPVMAQSAPAPAQRNNADANGVDLVTGSFNFEIVEGQIGPSDGGITMMRYWGQAGWRDNWTGMLGIKTTGGVTTATVDFGRESDKFTWSGSAYVNAKGNGATLTSGGGGLIYRASDGTAVTFVTPTDPNFSAATTMCNWADECSIPGSITRPDGRKFKYSWAYSTRCNGDVGEEVCATSYRLSDIRSSTGYAMKTKFKTNSTGPFGPTAPIIPPTDWFNRATVRLIDLSEGYCDPNGNDCDSTPGTWPTVNYTTSGPVVTDQYGGVWRVTVGTGNRITGIRRPGDSSDTITISYHSDGRVSSVTRLGETTTYAWSGTTNAPIVTITDPEGGVRQVTGNLPLNQVDASTNPVSQTTDNTLDGSGRVTEVVLPEGNKVTTTYDARGNVTQIRRTAKSGSGLAVIDLTAGYDSSCSDYSKCNKPNWTKDGEGNQTDYTYETGTGNLTKVRLPAPASGQPRPEVNYSYSSVQGEIKGINGLMVPSGDPEYRVTQVTTCATAATCAGTANETKTTLTYDGKAMQPATVTVAAGDGSVSATTTMTYDASGNVATVDGPLAGTDDKSFSYTDPATNLPKGNIGPDPDGAGSRPRAASRTTYDVKAQLTKAEAGTTTGTTLSDLNSMTVYEVVDYTYDDRGLVVKEVLSTRLVSTDALVARQVVQYGYDDVGRLECTALRMNPAVWGSLPSDACTLSTTGSDGPDRITKNIYDAAGRATKVQTAYGTAAQSDEVTGTYTANGQVASVTDGEGNKTSYVYDGHDRLSETRYPSPTTDGVSSTTDYAGFSYDKNGNVTSLRLRDGTSIALGYDKLDRVVTKDLPGSEPDATYSMTSKVG